MTKVLILEDHKALFRDDASFEKLVAAFKEAVEQSDAPLVLANSEVLFAAISPEDAQEMLCRRIVHRLAKNPGIMDTLMNRLDSDDFVE